MPLIRKSLEPLIRATRSQRFPALKSRADKDQEQKSGSPRGDPKEKRLAKEVAGSPKRKGRGLKPAEDADEEEHTSIHEAGGQRGRKRQAETSEPLSAKKPKPGPAGVMVIKSHPEETVSPRRSSRAVVPNSRFKDMEMLEPLKRQKKQAPEPSPAGKPKEKSHETGKKRKAIQPGRDAMIKGVQILQQVAEVVTEEIITEETPIDAEAQLNMLDEVLLAPSDSSVKPTQHTSTDVSSEQLTDETQAENLTKETTELKNSDEGRQEGQKFTSKPVILRKNSAMHLVELKPISDAWNEKYGYGVAGKSELISTQQQMVELDEDKTCVMEDEIIKTPVKTFDIPRVIVQCESKTVKRPKKVVVTPTHTHKKHFATQSSNIKGEHTKSAQEVSVHNDYIDNKASPSAPKIKVDIIKMKSKTKKEAVSLLSTVVLNHLEKQTLSQEETAYSTDEQNDEREEAEGEREIEDVCSGVKSSENYEQVTATSKAIINMRDDNHDKDTLQPEVCVTAENLNIPFNKSETANNDNTDIGQIREVDGLENSLREESKHNVIKQRVNEMTSTECNIDNFNLEDSQTEGDSQNDCREEVDKQDSEENQNDKLDNNKGEGWDKKANTDVEREKNGKEIRLTEDGIMADTNIEDSIIKVTIIEDNTEQNIIEYGTIEANHMIVSPVENNNIENSTIENDNMEDSHMVDNSIDNGSMGNNTFESNTMENENVEDRNMGNNTMEGSNIEDNNMESRENLSKEKSAASLCQVISLEQGRETQHQTAIEYVMFGDKMVPIHKPLTPHGRVTTQKPAVAARKRPGRVEVGGVRMNSSGMMKKIPLTAAQTVINHVLEQIEDNKELSPVVINDPVKLALDIDTTRQQMTVSGEEEKSAEPEKRVVHGYIDHSSSSSGTSGTIEPTQIVEISQDLFAKEVYGETNMAVDPVAGEILGEGLVATPMQHEVADNNVAVATSVASEATENVSMAEATESSEQNEQGEQGASGVESGLEATSLPLEAGSETDPDSVKPNGQSDYYENKDTVHPSPSIEIVNVSIPAEHLLQCSEESQISGSTMDFITAGQTKPTVVNLGVIETDYPTPVDPKVTTHYNTDGSMVIRIEGTVSAPPKPISSVTVPNVIRVKSKKPGVITKQKKTKQNSTIISSVSFESQTTTPSYITIPSWTTANQSSQSQSQSQPQKVAYKKLSDVKINPAVGVRQVAGIVKRDSRILAPSVERQQILTSTSTQTKSESETQTENTDEEEEEEGEEEEEEGIEINEVVISSEEKNLVKTRMSVQEDGKLQEYVVVGLPEGTEIKQEQAKQAIKDPVHDEVVTMGEDGMYVCVDCNHKTDKKSNWYKHRRKHLGIRPHACTRCNYKAATSSNLKRHMQIHDDIRNFVCSVCSLMFRQKIHLERHIKYKHQEKKVKCPLCDYLCSSENPDLKIHIRRRHMPYEGGSMGAFTCTECGLMTVSKKDLKQHMKFHKKGPELKLFCEFCSFVTDCESRLRRHMLIHTKERPFQCGLCEYRASQKEHVLRHMRSQHDVEVERRPRRSLLADSSGEKGVGRGKKVEEGGEGGPGYLEEDTQDSMSDTDKPFEKSDYSSTDKIFACNHCSMKFSKLINLYKHLYVQHKQVMPEPGLPSFQCVVCEFATNNKKNLLVHMRKHNMQDHTPPSHVYSCVLCRYMNPRRRNLFQHMKKKHGIEIVMKEDGSNCYVTTDNSSVVFGTQTGNEPSVIALSDIVTTESIDDETRLQIVTDDGTTFQGGKISIENIISVEEMAAYVSGSEATTSEIAQSEVVSSMYQTVAGHEAAEAIEGLQALAQQPGVLETQTVDNDITAEIVTTTEILGGEEAVNVMAGIEGEAALLAEGVQVEEDPNAAPGIELSTEQINQLSTGDYVEINGEVYKVEIAQQDYVVKL